MFRTVFKRNEKKYKKKGMVGIGVADNAVKDWLRDKERFADLFNGIVYGGEEVIKPEELTERNSEMGIVLKDKDGKERSVSRRRDIIMNWNNTCNLVILAIESQQQISYAMPVRNMLYDALAYTEQMKAIWNSVPKDERPKLYSDEFFSRFRKEDKLYPVVTLVLYYGESGNWDGSLSVYDMFDENMSAEQKMKLQKYVADYKINLVELDKIPDINVFKSDLRETIGMLQYKNEGEKLKEYVEENKDVLSELGIESRRVIRDVMKIINLEKYVKDKDGKEVVDMCKAVQEIKEEGEVLVKIKMITKKLKKGKTLDVIVEELEDELSELQPIYDAIMKCGVDEDINNIYKVWRAWKNEEEAKANS